MSSSPACVGGASPRSIAWAARMISERAACRKTSTSLVDGTSPDAIRSSSTRPGPTGASWSTSPTSRTCVRGPTASTSAPASRTSSIEASSTTSRSTPVSGSSASRAKPSPGTHSSSRWIVVASAPVASDSRLAALPVGAHSRTVRLCSLSRSTSARIVAVLPVPGRPVRIDKRCSAAACTAAHCAGVGGCSPSEAGRPGRRRRASAARPPAPSRARPAGARSGPSAAPGRARRRRGPARRPRRATATTSIGSSSSRAARGTSSPRGRKQWPSCSLARSTWCSAAWMRSGASAGVPIARATTSAVANAIPSTFISA